MTVHGVDHFQSLSFSSVPILSMNTVFAASLTTARGEWVAVQLLNPDGQHLTQKEFP